MANTEHMGILRQGCDTWNQWRQEFPKCRPDLSYADLTEVELPGIDLKCAYLVGANLVGVNLTEANLTAANLRSAKMNWSNLTGADLSRAVVKYANLSGAQLTQSNLNRTDFTGAILLGCDLTGAEIRGISLEGADASGANFAQTQFRGAKVRGARFTQANLAGIYFARRDFEGVDLEGADLAETDFRQANLSGAKLAHANLTDASLAGANLTGADLTGALLVRTAMIRTNLSGAILTGCHVYGASVWDVCLDGATQTNLVIAAGPESEIAVDNLEVAQFLYLLLENEKLRHVIDVLTLKIVLILGRFGDRKPILSAISKELRRHGLVPVIFDFDPSRNQRLVDTVTTLARLALFVIIDISDPSCAPAEAQAIIPELSTVPVQLIWQRGTRTWWMIRDFTPKLHPSLIPHGDDPAFLFDDEAHLVAHVDAIVQRARERADQLRGALQAGVARWNALAAEAQKGTAS